MTQLQDAQRVVALLQTNMDIPENIRTRLAEAMAFVPTDAQVLALYDTVLDENETDPVRLAAIRDLVIIAKGGTVP